MDDMVLMYTISFSYRLKAEVQDWKSKSSKMQMELNQLKAQYRGMEIKVDRWIDRQI